MIGVSKMLHKSRVDKMIHRGEIAMQGVANKEREAPPRQPIQQLAKESPMVAQLSSQSGSQSRLSNKVALLITWLIK